MPTMTTADQQTPEAGYPASAAQAAHAPAQAQPALVAGSAQRALAAKQMQRMVGNSRMAGNSGPAGGAAPAEPPRVDHLLADDSSAEEEGFMDQEAGPSSADTFAPDLT